MKTRFQAWKAATVLTILAASGGGCSTMNNTERDAAVGGGVGAGAGALAGSLVHAPVAGALLGGALGATGGAIIGSDKDAQVRHQQDMQYASAAAAAQAQAQAGRLGITDVIHMAQAGQSEQVIINQIQNTGSTFQLSLADLDTLKQNNVPPNVITAMQNARPSPVVVAPPGPNVIYQPAPAPPVVVVRPYGYPYGYGYRRGWGW